MLTENKNKIRGRDEKWLWFTEKFDKLGYVHVHNNTSGGGWTYELALAERIRTTREWDTRDGAYLTGLERLEEVCRNTLHILTARGDGETG